MIHQRGALITFLALLSCSTPSPEVILQTWPEHSEVFPFSKEEAALCHARFTLGRDALPVEINRSQAFEPASSLQALLSASSAPTGAQYEDGGAWAVPFDLNGDGSSDLLMRLPDATGSLALHYLIIEPGQVGDVEQFSWASDCWRVGDLDTNGLPDLVCADKNNDPPELFVAWNDGSYLNAVPRSTDLNIATADTVTSADLDRDQDLDLMIARKGGVNQILLNNLGEEPPFVALEVLESSDESLTFYLGAVTENPWDPLGPLRLFEDNDGSNQRQQSHLFDAGVVSSGYDPITPECDIVHEPQIAAWLGRAPSEDELQAMTSLAVSAGLADPNTGRIRIGHFNGPDEGDLSSPMGALRFTVGGMVCDMKTTSSLLFHNLSACYDRTKQRWVHLPQWSFSSGLSSGGLLQESWGAAVIETGSSFPTILIARGNETEDDNEISLMKTVAGIFDMELGTEFGTFNMGAFRLSPDGDFVELANDLGLTKGGNFANIETAWLTIEPDEAAQQYVFLGGFDGTVQVYRVIQDGNILRASLRAHGNAPATGSNLYVLLDGRVRGPMSPGMQDTQWRLGNTSETLDMGVGDRNEVSAVVHWSDGSIERFDALNVTLNQIVALEQGSGTPTALPVEP